MPSLRTALARSDARAQRSGHELLHLADIKSEGAKVVTTAQMGDAVVGELNKLVA